MKKLKIFLLIIGFSLLALVSFVPQTHARSSKVWDENKSQKLNQFMNFWGVVNNHRLNSYTVKNNIDFGGTKYPKSLNKNKIIVDNKKYTAGWSDSGKGNKYYNVVACYSDGKPDQIVGHSLYLFAFHKNKPVILATDDGQNLSKKGYKFVNADDTDLTKYFGEVIKGKDAANDYKQAKKSILLEDNSQTEDNNSDVNSSFQSGKNDNRQYNLNSDKSNSNYNSEHNGESTTDSDGWTYKNEDGLIKTYDPQGNLRGTMFAPVNSY